MLTKGKVLTVYCRSFLWVHFPLKNQVDYVWHNSTITPLCLIGVTNAKNMWSNATEEGENANGTFR